MFAIFETGGKQYKVETGESIYVEKLDMNPGETIIFDQIMMIDAQIGAPYLKGAKIAAKIVKHGKGKKIRIIKFKSKKHHMKRQGHRQPYTLLQIESINS